MPEPDHVRGKVTNVIQYYLGAIGSAFDGCCVDWKKNGGRCAQVTLISPPMMINFRQSLSGHLPIDVALCGAEDSIPNFLL